MPVGTTSHQHMAAACLGLWVILPSTSRSHQVNKQRNGTLLQLWPTVTVQECQPITQTIAVFSHTAPDQEISYSPQARMSFNDILPMIGSSVCCSTPSKASPACEQRRCGASEWQLPLPRPRWPGQARTPSPTHSRHPHSPAPSQDLPSVCCVPGAPAPWNMKVDSSVGSASRITSCCCWGGHCNTSV